VVGEAQGTAVLAQLAFLWRPDTGRLDDFEAADEQMVDRVGGGRAGEAEALAQLFEDRGVPCGPEVEVAAEDQRRVAGPLGRGHRRAQHVLAGELGTPGGRVQVGDAEPRAADPRERHHPPLRAPRVNRHRPPLDGSPRRSVATFVGIGDETRHGTDQGEVRAALVRGDQVGVEAGGE
jgi:hypothetical protein